MRPWERVRAVLRDRSIHLVVCLPLTVSTAFWVLPGAEKNTGGRGPGVIQCGSPDLMHHFASGAHHCTTRRAERAAATDPKFGAAAE